MGQIWAKGGPNEQLSELDPESRGQQKTRKALSSAGFVFFVAGGRYWDRTSDPCRVKAVLYR